jgi:two-component system, chemotaxis family, sensor kinase CheA
MRDHHANAYREEAAELIAGLETSLLELERSPADMDLVGTVFRALHTIKGSGAMFGFDAVAAFTHEIESAFDLVREGKLGVTRELINATLAARDYIKALLEGGGQTGRGEEILRNLRDLVGNGAAAPGVPETPVDAPVETPLPEGVPVTYRVRFTPSAGCLLNGANPLLLLRELAGLGECTVTARREKLPALGEMDPELCYLGWDLVLTTGRGMDAIRDVFIFVEGDAEVQVQVADSGLDSQVKRLGDILVDRGDVSAQQVEAALDRRPRTGELLVQAKLVGREHVESALAEQEHVREVRERQERADIMSSIRVPAGKLDSLVNIVGELVTVRARLTQLAATSGDPEMVFVAEEVERLTEKLRDNTMNIRMLPIGATFSRFRRLVRDLSRELGKEVELDMEGGDTELDKTVIERLSDPLVHLIRNSLDHGIEPPDVRESRGKLRQGRIRLSAVHSGTSVVIRIADDGAGLNAAAIRARAVERGLASPDASLTEEQIFAFILEPGFSTAGQITGVSGRGVGMDVVKRSIEALRGSLQIASAGGQGTTITLRLPLTLAIIDGLLVRVGDAAFVLPLSNILECIELGPRDLRRAQGRNIVWVRNQMVGCVPLRDAFGIGGDAPPLQHAVIAETSHGKYGFVVDVVVGDHQTVIKPLSGLYRRVQAISGATILGDGAVALIVDVDKLAAIALHEEAAHCARRQPA